MDRFKEKQHVEKAAVLKKFESGKRNIEKKREKDLQELINKYEVLRENLQNKQKNELNNLLKSFKSFKTNSNIGEKSMKSRLQTERSDRGMTKSKTTEKYEVPKTDPSESRDQNEDEEA